MKENKWICECWPSWVTEWLLLFLSSPEHLLRPWGVSPRAAESIPPQRLHSSGAMQPGLVWFTRPLSAQKPRQRCLLAPEPPHPQHQQAQRQTHSDRGAWRSRGDEVPNWVSVPVLQRLPGGGLRSDGPPAPERGGGSNHGISTAMCDLTDCVSAPLLMHRKQ